jgi:hypothetical protein
MDKLKAFVDLIASHPFAAVGVVFTILAAAGVLPLARFSGTNFPIVGNWRVLVSVIGIAMILFDGARAWRRPSEAQSLTRVTGGFIRPAAGALVTRALSAEGWTKNLERGLRLWLIVEVGTHKWPKGDELRIDADGKWQCEVYEDGTGTAFSLSLYVVNDEGTKKIRSWLDIGTLIGYHPFEVDIPGTRRLARVDGLRV